MTAFARKYSSVSKCDTHVDDLRHLEKKDDEASKHDQFGTVARMLDTKQHSDHQTMKIQRGSDHLRLDNHYHGHHFCLPRHRWCDHRYN